MDESSSESSMQSCLQWSAYLTIQLVVATFGVENQSNFKFSALLFSSLVSTLSQTMGQIKVTTMSMTILTYTFFLKGAMVTYE